MDRSCFSTLAALAFSLSTRCSYSCAVSCRELTCGVPARDLFSLLSLLGVLLPGTVIGMALAGEVDKGTPPLLLLLASDLLIEISPSRALVSSNRRCTSFSWAHCSSSRSLLMLASTRLQLYGVLGYAPCACLLAHIDRRWPLGNDSYCVLITPLPLRGDLALPPLLRPNLSGLTLAGKALVAPPSWCTCWPFRGSFVVLAKMEARRLVASPPSEKLTLPMPVPDSAVKLLLPARSSPRAMPSSRMLRSDSRDKRDPALSLPWLLPVLLLDIMSTESEVSASCRLPRPPMLPR